MGPFSFFKRVYDLDTLDTRFTTPSNAPYQTVIDARSDPIARREAADKAKSRVAPSRWRSPEFVLYVMTIALVVPYMFWVAFDVSRPSDPRYKKYEPWLKFGRGWIPGRRIDLSEAQYYIFRTNLPYMGSLVVFHPLLRRLYNSYYKPTKRTGGGGLDRLEQRASFDAGFAIVFLFVLYGVSAVKILTILTLNYRVATRLPRSYVPAATWIFNCGTLFANELMYGYRLGDLSKHFAAPDSSLVAWGKWIDSYGGILGRWEVLFNITILRLISFNLDYYWSLDRGASSAMEKKQLDPANLSERDRVAIPAEPQDYSFRNYLAYTVYAPLYLAGPILTFNDYIAQLKHRAATIERSRTILYAVRFVFLLLSMEVTLHFIYICAISKASPVWRDYTAAQLSVLSLFNLHIIWLKLLIPWRLFRLWALVDGIDPPENMVRCVSNNYSVQLFWRAWHRSYNRWIIRYIYIPLGGLSLRTWRSTARTIITYLLVFTFVALWHDIKMRLLIWGWLIVLFMLPEWTAAYFFPPHKWENRPEEYRRLCGLGAVANIIMMMSANLVGFAVGLDGLESIIRSILHDWSGLIFITVASGVLYMASQVMFEMRETEKRKGRYLKC